MAFPYSVRFRRCTGLCPGSGFISVAESSVDSIDVMGLLSGGTSIDAARAELAVLERRMSELDPQRDPRRRLVMADARGIHPGLARHIGPCWSRAGSSPPPARRLASC